MKALNWTFLGTVALAAVLLTSGCSDTAGHTRGVYMLMDTSGTYTKELDKAKHIINYILAKLNPGDSFVVARVDTGSFSEKDLVAKATFDDRPSRANVQKREFADSVSKFVAEVKPSQYTDITGGVLQAVEFLNETGASRKTVLIFSDLKEELQKGYVRDIPLQVAGYDVVALNVTKLRSDNVDPREYMDRMEKWRQKVESGGGQWRVINDLEKLEKLLGE